jgi:hypothetical protein
LAVVAVASESFINRKNHAAERLTGVIAQFVLAAVARMPHQDTCDGCHDSAVLSAASQPSINDWFTILVL